MKPAKLVFPFLGICALFVFVAFSYLVQKHLFAQFDFNTTVRVQDHFSRRFDTFFSSLSLIGSFEVVGVVLIGLLLVRKKITGLFVLFLFGCIHLFELYGKAFVNHPGPPFLFFRNNIGFNFPTAYIQPGSSYPSGHAARAAFMTIVILFMFGKSKKLSPQAKLLLFGALIAYDLVMFTSRVYLGEHWASDVMGGAILGTALGCIATFVL
ncbi:MAG TPA: phosphatase PAP2 family protein [Candidatus Saccharimonadales bacterium]|nr:phosphatase PAP2 family protein [Candidatus Saccharimonadales bacterium]